MLEYQLVVHRYAGFVFPSKWTAKFHQCSMKTLQPLGLRHGPRPNPRDMKHSKIACFSSVNTPCMKRKKVAHVIIEQHRKAKVCVKRSHETIHRQMVLWYDGYVLFVKPFYGALAVQFVGMNDHDVWRFRCRKCLIQPGWKAVSRGSILGCYTVFQIQNRSPNQRKAVDHS